MATEEFYNLLVGPHGRAVSQEGYWDTAEVSNAPGATTAGVPLVPAHYFGPEYSTPATPGTGGYIRNGKAVTASAVVDLS